MSLLTIQTTEIMVNWHEYIVSDSDILTGKPTIRNTRLSVEFIMGRLANGWTEKEIIENYPILTEESLKAVYAFTYEFIKDSMFYTWK